MRFFPDCFGSLAKHRKNKKTRRRETQAQKDQKNPSESLAIKEAETEEEAQIDKALKFNASIKDKNIEDQLNSNTRKTVTFGLNVKSSSEEECQVPEEAANSSVQGNDDKGNTEESKHKEEKPIVCSKEEEEAKGSDSSVSSLFSYPPNLRYHNCSSSDDDCVEMDSNQSNSDDGVDDGKNDETGSLYKEEKNTYEDFALVQEASSESLFSVTIDSRKQNLAGDAEEKEVCSPLKQPCEGETSNENGRDRSNHVLPVLNPIDNLSQWKAVRAKNNNSPMMHQEKKNLHLQQKDSQGLEEENAILPLSEDPSFKKSPHQLSRRFSSHRPEEDELTVDGSLSSWLMGSGKVSNNENSPGSVGNSSSKTTKNPKSFEDRPILGALTIEDLKMMSKASSSSPRRSPSHSPDDMTIIGTVGSYWRQTGEAECGSSREGTTASRSRDYKKGGMKSPPFQTRLDRALEGDAVPTLGNIGEC